MNEDNGMNFAEFVAILSGNTDFLNMAKLDNKIMQLEKEHSIFKKERSRSERKIATNTQEIDKAKSFISCMEIDYNYFKDYKGERIICLNTIGESAGEIGA